MQTRHAVVTGASTGIGAATVRALVASGWQVTGVARREDRLNALAAETGCAVIAADLTVPQEVASLVATLGDVDALVQIAGGARGADRVEHGDEDDWRWMYEANVLATQRLVKSLLPGIRRRINAGGGHGDLLFVTSTAAQDAYVGGGGYNAAKAAESMLVGALRLELGGEPIRVIEIAPGMVHTEEFSLRRMGGDADAAAKVYADVDGPLVADDVADVIRYALDAPGHVNLDLVTLRPVAQTSVHTTHRGRLTTRGADA